MISRVCCRPRIARDGRGGPLPQERPKVKVRPVPTIIVGAIGGLVVGITSVGSGSLIIISLMALYPMLRASELVGTDLVQAVPLVWSAAFGHILFGDFKLSITLPLLVGSIPGVYLGARMSAGLPGGIVRRALAFVLLASSLKLFGVDTKTTALILLGVLVIAPPLWMVVRRRHGLPAFGRRPARAALPAQLGADDAAETRAETAALTPSLSLNPPLKPPSTASPNTSAQDDGVGAQQ